jgi:curved DNA-binding protein CbpA
MNQTPDVHECYKILEIEPGAPWEEVKRSYRALIKVWHPDRFLHDQSMLQRVQEKTQDLNLAYDILCKQSEIQTPPSIRTAASTRSDAVSGRPGPARFEREAFRTSWTVPPSGPAAVLDQEALRREALRASFARGAGIRKGTVFTSGARGRLSFEQQGGDTACCGWILVNTSGSPIDLLPEKGAATAEEAKVHFYPKWRHCLFTHDH